VSIWSDLLGTTKAFFRIGFTGPRLKDSAGSLVIRNPGDTADAQLTASKVNVSGDVLEINSDAANTGADYKVTLQRPAAGMTAAYTLTLPVDDGTPGQILATDGNGVLSWQAAGNTLLCNKLDTTSIAFGSAGTIAMFTTGAGDIVDHIDIIIDTPFNGAPTLSGGVAGTTSKYFAANQIDLSQPAGAQFSIYPALGAQGAEALIATYAAGGATAGAARIIVSYATPA
jgi:hypothetical protein